MKCPRCGVGKVSPPPDLRKMSYGDIHRTTGISRSHLSRIFAQERGMSVQNAHKIAQALGMTIDDLVEGLELV